MASKNELDEVELFTNGPLFKWFTSCMEFTDVKLNEDLSYETLLDGVFIHQVFCQTGLQVINDNIVSSSDQNQRYLNLKNIMDNIRQFFEIDQKAVILNEPNIENLIKDPTHNVCEMENLLYLLLGCAISSPNKNKFTDVIKNINLDDRTEIVKCIEKVLITSEFILNFEMLTDHENQEKNALRALDYIREMKTKSMKSCNEIDFNQSTIEEASKSEKNSESSIDKTNKFSSIYDLNNINRLKFNEIMDKLEAAYEKSQETHRASEQSMCLINSCKTLIKVNLMQLDDKKDKPETKNDELVDQCILDLDKFLEERSRA